MAQAPQDNSAFQGPDEVREALNSTGRNVRAEDDSVLLYHASSLEGAQLVLDTRTLATRESTDGVYVSTSPAIVSLRGDWQVVLPVRVVVPDLELSADERENEDAEIRRVDFRIRVDEDGNYEPLAVGRAAYDSFGAPHEPMPDDWDI